MRVVITLLGLLTCLQAFAQSPAELKVIHKFDEHRVTHLQEKLYLHADRTFYLTGETMWFKIYLVDGSLHKKLALSKVAYVEIIQDQTAVLQTKIELKEGTGNGSFFIPATLASGNYTIRAYTNWMKNSDPEFYYHQPITIINPFKSMEAATSEMVDLRVSFFPEGGNLVNGLTSKVAFKIHDQHGNGVDGKGAVVNRKNDTVATFASLKFGLGNFTMTPSAADEYKALLIDPKGKVKSFSLPPIFQEGYVMRMKDERDQLIITIQNTGSSPENILLFAHNRQVITKTEVQASMQGITKFVINKELLRDGISHLTVFNGELQPVCERLYFKRPAKNLSIHVGNLVQKYETREKVRLNITTTNENNLPVAADLSMSVYQLDSLPALDRTDIVSYLYLTSDLTGVIESPAYYISGTDKNAEAATDNLMLTHGWRRFSWSNVFNAVPNPPQYIPEYRSHIIEGKVRTLSGETASYVSTYLSTPGKSVRLYTSRSNAQGRIQFEMKNFYGSQKIIAQTNQKLDSTFVIEIKSPFSGKYAALPSPSFNIPSTHEKNLLKRSISMQVQDVFYENRLNRFKRSTQDSSAFYGEADESYLLDDYTRFPVMEEVMREYVKGVWVRKRKDGFHFLVLDNVNHDVFEENPLILMDGVPVFDVNDIMELNPVNIKKLDVFTRMYYLGHQSLPGIVSYSSNAGDMAGFQLDPKTLTLDYEGLQLQREFYAPQYEKADEQKSRLPDQRTLLHWRPDINTTQGKANVEFFTSDVAGNFMVIMEGMSADGKAGSAYKSFKVIPAK